jgi:hypothetical protein
MTGAWMIDLYMNGSMRIHGLLRLSNARNGRSNDGAAMPAAGVLCGRSYFTSGASALYLFLYGAYYYVSRVHVIRVHYTLWCRDALLLGL